MVEEGLEERSLEYTPTWIVASICSVIVLISLLVQRTLHKLGKWLKRKNQLALFEALQKLQEELMLLGFISLLLTVFQGVISHVCIPIYLASHMLPCKLSHAATSHALTSGRRLLSTQNLSQHCAAKGKIPLLSLEALHQLHIFIFVLAVVHVIFCAATMVLAGAQIRGWKHWEESIKNAQKDKGHVRERRRFFQQHTIGKWRKAAVVSWMISFFKQFHGSVTKSDYIALRHGFIMSHCPKSQKFNFYEYMMKTLEDDFRKVVGISWYLWLFVVLFLLLNLAGWHTYFWLSFLPLILLLLVGAKLEHIITQLAEEVTSREDPKTVEQQGETVEQQRETVKPSDEHFWFGQPEIVLYLIHFILFQNSFEIAFFFWIMSTYGFTSCIVEKLGYIIPRLIIGVIVEVLCSYSTLPLYAIVSQMGSMFKRAMFDEHMQVVFRDWAEETRSKREGNTETHQMATNPPPPTTTTLIMNAEQDI